MEASTLAYWVGLVRRTWGRGPRGPSGPSGPRRNRQSERDCVWTEPAGAAATAGATLAAGAAMAPAGAAMRATAVAVATAAATMDPVRKPRVIDMMCTSEGVRRLPGWQPDLENRRCCNAPRVVVQGDRRPGPLRWSDRPIPPVLVNGHCPLL